MGNSQKEKFVTSKTDSACLAERPRWTGSLRACSVDIQDGSPRGWRQAGSRGQARAWGRGPGSCPAHGGRIPVTLDGASCKTSRKPPVRVKCPVLEAGCDRQ